MFQFIQIGVQVLRGKLVIRPDDRALKQAPHALYAVGVNITAHPFVLGVVDRFVTRVRVFYPSVVPILICVDRLAFWVSRFFHKLSELKSIAVRNDLQSNVSAALNSADHRSLVSFVPAAPPMNLAAYKCFVDLYDSLQFFRGDFAHSGADTVTEKPRSFVSRFKSALNLESGNPLFRLDLQINEL